MIQYSITPKDYWIKYIEEIVNIMKSVTPKTPNKKLGTHLSKIRHLFYEVFITNIDTKKIIKQLMYQLIYSYEDLNLIEEIIEIISKYELRLTLGKRHIIHLETCVNVLLDLIVNKKVELKTF
jgi:hypothetical protein